MTKEESIANRVKALMAKNGYTKFQATAIVRNQDSKPKAQFGVQQPWYNTVPNLDSIIQSQKMSPQQDFSVANQNYLINAHTPAQPQNPATVNPFFSPGNYNEWDKDNNGIPDSMQQVEGNPNTTTPVKGGDNTNWSKAEQINNTNVANLYGGVDLEGALAYAGRGFGSGNAWQAGIGSSLFAVKGARNFLSGFASGQSDKQTYEDYMKKLNADQSQAEYVQQGGKIKNSEVMAMNAITDNPNGQINLEGGEFVKRNNGIVQPVVGEPHIKNGKIAEGVDAQLEGGDKVLSDYVKLRPNDIKELKDRYDISLKKGDTPAKAQTKFDAKIGLKKEEEGLATLAEKLEKALKIKDVTTQELSVQALQSKIAKQNEKIAPLKEVSAMAFEDFFMRQEKIPKKDTSKIYDENGKEVTEYAEEKDVAQQGGLMEMASKYGISPERAEELIKMQMGGEMEQEQGQDQQMQQIMQQVAQALQQGADPNEVAQQLTEMGIPPEVAQQIIEQVISQLQGQGAPEQMQMEGQQEEMVAQQGGKMYAQGGENPFVQNSTLIKDFTQQPSGLTFLPQTPIKDNPNPIWKGDAQKKSGNYYEVWTPLVEQSLSDPNQAKKIDKWLSENKDKYSVNIQNQLEGLTGEARIARIKTLATDGKPGLFHNAVLDALKATKPKEELKVLETVAEAQGENKISPAQVTNKTVFPMLPQRLSLPPSGIQPIGLQEINLGRLEPNKATIEPYLANQAQQQLTAREQLSATGLPPQIQEALSTQQFASGQMSANDAIAKTENFNRTNQMQVDQFNIGQRAKEDITNAQFKDTYMVRNTQARDNSEKDWRAYLNELSTDNARNYSFIENTRTPAQDEYTYVAGKGYVFNNNKAGDISVPTLTAEQFASFTPEQMTNYMRNVSEMSKKKQMATKNQQ